MGALLGALLVLKVSRNVQASRVLCTLLQPSHFYAACAANLLHCSSRSVLPYYWGRLLVVSVAGKVAVAVAAVMVAAINAAAARTSCRHEPRQSPPNVEGFGSCPPDPA